MTVSVKAPTSTTGSIQLNGSDVLTIDSSGNLTAPNNLTANTIIPTSSSAPTNGMFLPTTNTVGVSTNSTERMRIGSSGDVGLNATSPGNRLYVSDGGNQHGSTSWATNAAIRADGGWLGGIALTGNNSSSNLVGWNFYGISNSNPNGATLHIRGGSVGSTTANGVYLPDVTSTSWSSASDERLKQNLEPITNALNKVSTLRAVIGEFTNSPGFKHPFLIAQDVQAVLPEAVSIAEPDTEEQYLGLSYTDVIPLLTAALQEAITKIEDLETRIQTLESA